MAEASQLMEMLKQNMLSKLWNLFKCGVLYANLLRCLCTVYRKKEKTCHEKKSTGNICMTKSLDQSWRRLFCAVRLTKTKPGEFLGHCSWASSEPHWTEKQRVSYS